MTALEAGNRVTGPPRRQDGGAASRSRRLSTISGLALLGFSLTVTACGGGAEGHAEPAASAATSTAEAAGPTEALLLQWKPDGGYLTPIMASGQDVPGVEPVALGRAQPGALGRARATIVPSPDGESVVVNSGLPEIYRMQPWGRASGLHELVGVFSSPQIAWSPSGDKLFAVAPGRLLLIADPGSGDARPLGDLGFWTADSPAFSPDGRALYFLGFQESDPGAFMVEGDPFVAAVDADSGAVRARVDLPGLLVGQRLEENGAAKYSAIYRPAMAVARDGSRAYVVHPDSDRVTVVDLFAMRVERTVAMAPRRSRWARLRSALGGLFVSHAQAKGGLSFDRQAIVSPDGKRLYVTGTTAEPCRDGFACEDQQPAGLRVVDTATMEVLHQEEGINRIALSPDGRSLVGTGSSWADGTGWIGRGLKLLDARSGRLVAHLGPEAPYTAIAFGRGGHRLYALAPIPAAIEAAGSNQGRCDGPCNTLTVIDVGTRAVVATRDLFGSWGELFGLPAAP